MKIFFQNNKLNPTVKIIKEEKISQYSWNVAIHTFKLEDKKVSYSLETYKEVSDAVKMSLNKPVDYEFYGNYYETSCYNLKHLQAKCIGVRVLISVVFQENVDRDEVIHAYASMKKLSMDTIYSLVESRGWSFQTVEAKDLPHYKFTTEGSKKVMTPYIKLVDRIFYDEEKRIVIVFFVDGTKIVKKCHAEDNFDVCVGVSLAITKYLFGNNTTHFIKFVDRKKKKLINKKEAEEQQPKTE